MSLDEREVLAGIDRHLDAVHAAFPVPPRRQWPATRRTVPGPWIAVATIAAIAIGIVALGRAPAGPGPVGSAHVGVVVSPSQATLSPSPTSAASADDHATVPVLTPAPSRPLDPAIEAVSKSNPGPAAQRAMDLCGVKGYGIGTVGGMGLIPDARRVPDYVPLSGREPELAVDKPAWVIAFEGWLTMVTRTRSPITEVQDPVCVVIDGAPFMFLTGASRAGDVIVPPPPSSHEPTYALPPLAP
jgi:hypothetical protein